MKCEAYLVGRGLLVVMLIVLLTNRKDYELFLSDVVFAFDGSRSESGVFAPLCFGGLRFAANLFSFQIAGGEFVARRS